MIDRRTVTCVSPTERNQWLQLLRRESKYGAKQSPKPQRLQVGWTSTLTRRSRVLIFIYFILFSDLNVPTERAPTQPITCHQGARVHATCSYQTCLVTLLPPTRTSTSVRLWRHVLLFSPKLYLNFSLDQLLSKKRATRVRSWRVVWPVYERNQVSS